MIQVQSGPFKSSISSNDIEKVRKTKNPFTAPALSIDRLEILYGKVEAGYSYSKCEDLSLIQAINEARKNNFQVACCKS